MTTNMSDGRKSYVYVGLAGETGPGRSISSGLYRMADAFIGWQTEETTGSP